MVGKGEGWTMSQGVALCNCGLVTASALTYDLSRSPLCYCRPHTSMSIDIESEKAHHAAMGSIEVC